MSITDIKWIPAAIVLMFLGCASSNPTRLDIVVGESTKELQGWLSVRGEWTLFPIETFSLYYPFTKDENQKCVSMVNQTGKNRNDYMALEGKFVTVTGYSVAYEKLADGNEPADRLLAKKYYKDKVVQNFCLREFVFVVTEIVHEKPLRNGP